MDNARTGAFIKELRRERNMTQKELADALHITDRAVSKWERGLNAPDIALLEPLSEALGATVAELIRGERAGAAEPREEVKTVLEYSQHEVARKVRGTRTRYLALLLACLLLAAAIGAALLWRSGVLFVLDRKVSPDGRSVVTVYNRDLNPEIPFALFGGQYRLDLDWLEFGAGGATSILGTYPDGGKERITFERSSYKGLWWAPDSEKYAVAIRWNDDRDHILLMTPTSVSNLSIGVGYPLRQALRYYGCAEPNEYGEPDFRFQFLQWSKDSESVLLSYAFEDAERVTREGYFWYNCYSGEVSGIFELPAT